MPTPSVIAWTPQTRRRPNGLMRLAGRYGNNEGFYGRKQFNACEFVPFYGQRGICSVCGSDCAGRRRDDFCSAECEQHFSSNHDWALAKPAAMHRDGYTCTRCGHRPDPADPQACASELVVRHVERPQSPQYAQKYGMPTFANTRRSGCHQHLENLITVCRFCDDADISGDPDLFSESTDVVDTDTPESEPVPTVSTAAPVGPTTSISDHDLDPGLCRQRDIDPDTFFEQRLRPQAVRLCAQCSVKALCAQRALDLRDTDGIIAGVFLPGKRFPDKLAERREQLQMVIDAANAVAATKAARAKADKPQEPTPAPVLHLVAGHEAYVELERASA